MIPDGGYCIQTQSVFEEPAMDCDLAGEPVFAAPSTHTFTARFGGAGDFLCCWTEIRDLPAATALINLTYRISPRGLHEVGNL